jgi:Uma2 family endonuclease
MSQPVKNYYTPQEYLALEEKANYKSEYFQGEIFQMAGANLNHDRIALDLLLLLQNSFTEKPCEAFSSEVRLLVKSNGLYTYPDASVVCGEVQFAEDRDDIITNPLMLVEVLSKSTRNYDRGVKFELYRGLPSFQIYLILDSLRVYAELHQKINEEVWQMAVFHDLDDLLKITPLNLELSLAQVYKRVRFKSEEPPKLRRKSKSSRQLKKR